MLIKDCSLKTFVRTKCIGRALASGTWQWLEVGLSETDDSPEKETSGPTEIVLPPECGLKEVEIMLDSVSDNGSPSVDIDASGVERMSASCAMAVVSMVRHAEANSGKVAVIKPAPPFMDAFTELGLFQEVMKMEFRQ